MDLGSTEHSFELGTHPQCTALRANPFANVTVGPPLAWLVSGLFAVSSIAGKIVDYGSRDAVGLFGLCQRMYVDSRSATDVNGPARARHRPRPR